MALTSRQGAERRGLFSGLHAVWGELTPADWLKLVKELAPSAGFARSGEHIKGRCPLHRHPGTSFVVTPGKGTAKCFGCHRTFFDPLALVAELRNPGAPNMADTLLLLRRRFGIGGVTETLYEGVRAHENEQSLKNKLCRFFCDELLEAIAAYPMEMGHDYAWARPAVEYLLSRRLGDAAPNEVAADLDEPTDVTADADPCGIWPDITSNQLLGIFPSEARVIGRFKAESEEHRFFRQYFGFLAADSFGFTGYLVVPLHDQPGSVRRFKLRAPSVEADAAFFVDDAFEAEVGGFRGFYGLHYQRTSLGLECVDGTSCADTVVVMEGELDALASIAQQIRRQSSDFITLAVAGAPVPLLDQLAAYGVEHARVVGDRESSSASLVDRVLAAPPVEKVAAAAFYWPEEYHLWRDPKDPERRILGPEAAVRWLGYPRWASHLANAERFVAGPAPRRAIVTQRPGGASTQLPLFEERRSKGPAKRLHEEGF